jgi:hypothetical protein
MKLFRKKTHGRIATNGINADLDLRISAHMSKMTLITHKGKKANPNKEISQTFAGLMTKDKYDTPNNTARIIIATRDVKTRKIFFFFCVFLPAILSPY